MSLQRRSDQACFGGRISIYSHASEAIKSEMRFALYLPPQAARTKVPALYYLAGLTCNEETFIIKAGALRLASEYGLALVACDTSPRGLNIPGDSAAWDFGVGAGFYIDATAAPWSTNYHMGSYVSQELPALIEKNFSVIAGRRGIFGHSMGGHGALVTALRDPTALAVGVGVRADLQSGRGALGQESLRQLPGRGYLAVGAVGCLAADAAAGRTRAISWSIRDWRISSWPSSCIRRRSKPRRPLRARR